MIKEKLFLTEDDIGDYAQTMAGAQAGITTDTGKNKTDIRNKRRISNKRATISTKKNDLDTADEYQKAYNDIHASVEDQKKLATDFLDRKYVNHSDVLKPLYPALIEEIDALGFDNDFLNFIDRVVVKYGITMTEDQYTVIHDLYANGFLVDDDLRGTTTDGANNIIFNKDLYKKSPKDMEFYIKCFNWFVPENREKITTARPIVNGKEVVIKDDYKDLRAFGDLKRLRNDLMFEGDVLSNRPEKSLEPLRPVNQIKAEMEKFQRTDQKLAQGAIKGENPGTDRTQEEGEGSRGVNQPTRKRAYSKANEKHWKTLEDEITKLNKGQELNNKEWQDFADYLITTKGLK